MIEVGQRVDVSERLPAYRWWIMAVTALTIVASSAQAASIPLLGVALRSELNINAAELSLFTTIPVLVAMAAMFVSAYAGSRIGAKRLVGSAFLCMAGLSLLYLSPLGHAYWGILVIRIFMGLCTGLTGAFLIGGPYLLWFRKRQRALVSGLVMGFLGVGQGLIAFVGMRLYDSGVSLQETLVLICCIPLTLAGTLYLLTVKSVNEVYPGFGSVDEMLPPDDMDESSRQPAKQRFEPSREPSSTFRQCLRDPRIYYICLFVVIIEFQATGFIAYMPQILALDLHMQADAVSAVLVFSFIITLIAAPLGGWLSDRIFRGRRWPVMSIGSLLCGILLALVPHTPAVWLTAVLMLTYFSISVVQGPTFSLPAEISVPAVVPKNAAIAQISASFGVGIFVVGIGLIYDSYGGLAMLYTLCAFSFLGSFFAYKIKQ